MSNQFYRPANSSGFQFDNNNVARDKKDSNEIVNKRNKRDEDLIIEDNTIYEIDRECYERMKRQRKRRV
jgi:hypothetical protein